MSPSTRRTDFVLDALEPAIDARCDDYRRLISSITAIAARQYLSMRDTERLADAGIEPSVGRRGDAYDCEHDGVAVRPGLTPATSDFVSWR